MKSLNHTQTHLDFSCVLDLLQVDSIQHNVVRLKGLSIGLFDDQFVGHVWKHVHMVTNEECVRHIGQLLRVLPVKLYRGGEGICDDVIHVGGTTRSRVAQPHHLYGSCLEGKQLIACSLRVAVHVDQNVNTICVDPVSCLPIARDLRETIKYRDVKF